MEYSIVGNETVEKESNEFKIKTNNKISQEELKMKIREHLCDNEIEIIEFTEQKAKINKPVLQVFLKTLEGKLTIHHVTNDTKTELFYSKMNQNLGIKENSDLRLVYGGKQFAPKELKFGDYGVQENATIIAAYRVKGGF